MSDGDRTMIETGFENFAAETGQGAAGCPDSAEGPESPQPRLKQYQHRRKGKPAVMVAAVLCARWAVTADSHQWMLSEFQRHQGVWKPRKFIYDRDELLEVIGELCGQADPQALATIRAWPERHATWWRLRTGRPTPSVAMAAQGWPEAES